MGAFGEGLFWGWDWVFGVMGAWDFQRITGVRKMSSAMLHVDVGGQESHTQRLIFNLGRKDGELKEAMEVKRVVRLRTVGQKKKTHRMWPHPMDALKGARTPHYFNWDQRPRGARQTPGSIYCFQEEHPD